MNEFVERATQPEPPVTNVQRVVRTLLAVGVLGLGVMAVGYLVATKPKPEKKSASEEGSLVEVIQVQPTRRRVEVPANGSIVPARTVAMAAEVGGRVRWLAPELVPGGRFRKGEVIARLDPRDYALALKQQRAQVDSASTALEIERSRKEIAEREWKLLGSGAAGTAGRSDGGAKPSIERGGPAVRSPGTALALRDPQVKTAVAALEAAQSGVERAELSVGKTVLRAPFNAMVHQKSVDVGQLVGPAVPVATLVGTDVFWVQAAVPVDRLRWFQIPGVDGATEGAAVEVSQTLGSDTITRQGEVIRLLGDLDPVGRMARVLIAIADPLGLETQPQAAIGEQRQTEAGLPLLIGSYVNVLIAGREVDGVVELDRRALRGGDSVYIMSDHAELEIRPVEVLWRQRETVLVTGGLHPGDHIVVSPLAAPVPGMKLRTRETSARAPGDVQTPATGSVQRGDRERGDGKRGDGKRGDGKRGDGKRGDGKRGGERGDGGGDDER